MPLPETAASSADLNDELRDVISQLEHIRSHADALTRKLSDTQFNWRPTPSQWSIGQCFDHLNRADTDAVQLVAAAMQTARRRKLLHPGPYRYGRYSRWLAEMMEPLPRRKMRAPARFVPPEQVSSAEVMSRFMSINAELQKLTRELDGIDLLRVKVRSPLPLLKMSLGARLQLACAHGRRHLYEARQVREDRKFPAA